MRRIIGAELGGFMHGRRVPVGIKIHQRGKGACFHPARLDGGMRRFHDGTGRHDDVVVAYGGLWVRHHFHIHGKPIFDIPLYIIRADKKRIPISVTTAFLKDSDGNIIGGVETFRDIGYLGSFFAPPAFRGREGAQGARKARGAGSFACFTVRISGDHSPFI